MTAKWSIYKGALYIQISLHFPSFIYLLFIFHKQKCSVDVDPCIEFESGKLFKL